MAERKKTKIPIKFGLELNGEQKEAQEIIQQNKITVLRGQAGSGKSLLAARVALEMLFTKEVSKIVLTRPTVTSGEQLGFLPGTIDAKLLPFTQAIYDNMYSVYHKEKIDSCLRDGLIEVIPLAFMRGRNMSDCVVVVDEAQNVTDSQMRLMLGRLCKGAKMILCGDMDQVDLPSKAHSGFEFICDNLRTVPGFALVTLQQNHRDPIVKEILEIYDNRRS